MKKSVLFFLGIIIGIAASYFYFNGDQSTVISTDVSAQRQSFVKPKGVITPAQAKSLNNNWTNSRKPAVDSAIGRPDNRSSWWSLKDMRDYLDYVENQTKGLGYTMNGVRIYLGVYGGKAPNGKADYTTMFLVPTGRKSTSQGNLLNIVQGGDKDIPGGDPLNGGDPGDPPSATYPQQ